MASCVCCLAQRGIPAIHMVHHILHICTATRRNLVRIVKKAGCRIKTDAGEIHSKYG